MKKEGIVKLISTTCFFILSSCGNSDINSEISKIMYKRIIIPYDKLDKRECSYYKDTLKTSSSFTLLVYVGDNQCSPCELAELSNIEKKNRQDEMWWKMQKIYVFNVKPENTDNIYAQLCNQRIEGDVFLDTCNIFQESNPVISNFKLFHTFILDRDGRITLVGNPFTNRRLKELLIPIIEKE